MQFKKTIKTRGRTEYTADNGDKIIFSVRGFGLTYARYVAKPYTFIIGGRYAENARGTCRVFGSIQTALKAYNTATGNAATIARP